MATDAKIASTIEVLLGDCQGCPEYGITPGMRHHAAAPVEGRLDRCVVTTVAVVALARRFKVANFLWLGAWLLDYRRYCISSPTDATDSQHASNKCARDPLNHDLSPSSELFLY
jgi:hypothetical protein